MKDYTIKELTEFINDINKNPDATIEVSVDRTSGIVGAIQGGGLFVKITPQPRALIAGVDLAKDDEA